MISMSISVVGLYKASLKNTKYFFRRNGNAENCTCYGVVAKNRLKRKSLYEMENERIENI